MLDIESLTRPDPIQVSTVLTEQKAICLFALARRNDAPDFPAIEFEDRLQLHEVGSIAAVIGIVPIAEYCGADAERNLADVTWLAPRVRRHAELVNWAMQWSPVYPAPFGTFYRTFESLTEFLRTHEDAIAAFLDRVAGKEEWELRAAAKFDSPELLDSLAFTHRPEWSGLSKGVRYMRICRDREALLELGRADAAAVVRNHVETIRPLAADVRELALGRNGDPNMGEPIARYALLVDKAKADELREAVRAVGVSQEHVALALSGPWPPFSFRPDLAAPPVN